MKHVEGVQFPRVTPRLHRRVTWDGGGLDRAARDGRAVGAQEQAGDVEAEDVAAETAGQPEAGAEATIRGQESELVVDQEAALPQSPKSTGEVGQLISPRAAQTGPAQLLRIIENIDQILLMRTRLRHQLETLRNSRTFLDASLQSLDALVRDAGVAAVQPGQQVLSTDSGIAVDHVRSAFSKGDVPARPGFPSFLEPGTTQGSEQTADRVTAFRASLAQIHEDIERVRHGEAEFTESLDMMSSLEFRLNEKQKRLRDDLRDRERSTQLVQQIVAETQVPLHTPASLRPTSDIPPIVERYFDRRGDVGVWMEREDELQEAWAEGLAERAFIADRGDPLEVTDEEFNDRYEQRLEHIKEELELARKDAEGLEMLCREAGHNVEAYRTTRRSESASDLSERRTASYSYTFQAIPEIDLDAGASQESARQPARRIDSWLRTVDLSDTGVTEDPVMPASAPQTPRLGDRQDRKIPPPSSSAPLELPAAISIEESSPDRHTEQPSLETNRVPEPPATSGLFPLKYSNPAASQPSPLSADDASPGQSISADTVETALTQATTPPQNHDETPTHFGGDAPTEVLDGAPLDPSLDAAVEDSRSPVPAEARPDDPAGQG